MRHTVTTKGHFWTEIINYDKSSVKKYRSIMTTSGRGGGGGGGGREGVLYSDKFSILIS